METSNTWSFRSIVGKIMMGLVLAAMIGSIDVVPVLGKDYKQNKGRYEQRGRGYDRDRQDYQLNSNAHFESWTLLFYPQFIIKMVRV